MENIVYLAPAIFLLAGTVKGAIGIGLPTTVIAILSQFVDPRLAVALGLVPVVFANCWQAYRERKWKVTLLRFWPFALTLSVVIYLGSGLAAGSSKETILLVTGAGIAVFAASSLIRRPPAMPPGWEFPAQVFAGAASGVMGGFTGLWAAPMIILLLSLRLDKSEFVGATGVLLFLGGLPLFAGYAVNGLITKDIFFLSLALCIPTYLGFALGERVRRRMDSRRFQKALLLFFLLIGLNMVRQALSG